MVQKTKTKNNHPYIEHENTAEWYYIEKALDDLVNNNDLIYQTSKEYIVGYVVQQLKDIKTEKGQKYD